MHPGAWILWAGCAGMVTFTTTNPVYLAVIIAASWLVYAAQHQPKRAGTFKLFVLAAVFTLCLRVGLVFLLNPVSDLMRAIFGGLFTIPEQVVNVNVLVAAIYQGLLLGTLLIVFGTFNAVTDPYGVLRLAPRHFYEPALAASLALSIAPRTIDAVGRVREAQLLRGIHPRGTKAVASLVIPVLETGMEDAVTLAESMDARGHGRGRRTKYRPQAWALVSTIAGVAAAVAMLGYLAAAFRFHAPSLEPVVDPLTFPPVNAALVVLAALLAVPAFLPRPAA